MYGNLESGQPTSEVEEMLRAFRIRDSCVSLASVKKGQPATSLASTVLNATTQQNRNSESSNNTVVLILVKEGQDLDNQHNTVPTRTMSFSESIRKFFTRTRVLIGMWVVLIMLAVATIYVFRKRQRDTHLHHRIIYNLEDYNLADDMHTLVPARICVHVPQEYSVDSKPQPVHGYMNV